MAKEFYEVVYTALDGNVVERDIKYFADEREAIAFHNSLKDNDKVASAMVDKVYYDPESFLSGFQNTEYYANPIHKDYLNSRSGDKRFEEPESIAQFLARKLKARQSFASSSELNEMKKEVSYRVEYTTLDGEKAKSSIYNSKKEADKKEAQLVNSGIRKAKVVEIPLNEGMPKNILKKKIKDINDALKSGEINGEDLTNETEQDLQQELSRLKKQMKSLDEDLKGLMAQGGKIAAFANKQSGYEGGVSSPVRGVLAAMAAAGAPNFNGDEDLKAYWTRKLSKAIETQMGKKYMSGLDESVNEAKEKFSVIVKQTGEVIDDGLPKDLALKLAAKKKGWVIQIDESLNSDISNAKKRLEDPHTIEDIEYNKTGKGDKFVKIIYKKKYVPGKMMDTGPHFVSIFYNDEKELQKIGKTLKLKLKEGIEEKSTSIEKIYMDMLRDELPSQDEVNDAFEKFERETHYLNNKPVGEWDAMDMSNWKTILRKGGRLH